MPKTKPVLLVVLDGWGIRAGARGERHRDRRDPERGRAPARVPLHRDRDERPLGRAPRGADGELRGRPHEPRRRAGSSTRTSCASTAPSRTGRCSRTTRSSWRAGARRSPAARSTSWGSSPTAASTATLDHLHACLELARREGVAARVRARLHGRAGHAAALGARLPRGRREAAEGARLRQGRDRVRPLLRDGPRQAVGPRRARVRRARARRGAPRRLRRRGDGGLVRRTARATSS